MDRLRLHLALAAAPATLWIPAFAGMTGVEGGNGGGREAGMMWVDSEHGGAMTVPTR